MSEESQEFDRDLMKSMREKREEKDRYEDYNKSIEKDGKKSFKNICWKCGKERGNINCTNCRIFEGDE